MKRFAMIIVLFAVQLFGDQSSALQMPMQQTYVYICTGPNATKYHCKSDCRGMNNCSKDVIRVTEAYAKNKGRTKCKICYARKSPN